MNAPRFIGVLLAFAFATAGAAGDGLSLPDYERVELDNGAVLLLAERHDVPLVGLQAIVRGGAVADPEGLNGLASLLAGVMQKGAGRRDAAEFAEAVAAVGGDLSVAAGLESITVRADFLARDAELMLELVADLLQRPVLDEEELVKLRDRSINLIKAAKGGNPGRLLPAYGNAFLFGAHPYGNPISGSETTLAAITHEDLLEFYASHVGGDRLIIAVVGDFNIEAMQSRLAAAFGGWREATAELPALEDAARQSGRRVLLVDKPGATQTYFWIANTGVSIHYPGRAELNLVNTLFGGRITSMLAEEMRVKAGLTYSARSTLSRYSGPGSVVISSFTETATTAEAIDMAIDILGRLHDSGVDEAMLASARNYIMGQFPPRLETAFQLAGQLAMLEAYGLDREYIDGYGDALAAVTEASAGGVIGEVYPDAENLVFILVGDAAKVRDAAQQYGPVTELPISAPTFRP